MTFGTVGLGVSGFPLHAMGALIKGTGGAEVAEVVALMARVVVVGVIGGEGNHPMSSGPHELDLEEDLFLFRGKCGGQGRDGVGRYSRLVLRGGGRASFGQFSDVPINILKEFQHTEWIHGDDKEPFDVMDDLSGSTMREGEGDIPERRGRR
jgi:hypothetical protein